MKGNLGDTFNVIAAQSNLTSDSPLEKTFQLVNKNSLGSDEIWFSCKKKFKLGYDPPCPSHSLVTSK